MKRTCLVCGSELPPKRFKYCSKQCGNSAFHERQRIKRREEKLKERSKSIDEYAKWNAQRQREGLPHISYGKFQGNKYLEKKRGEKDV